MNDSAQFSVIKLPNRLHLVIRERRKLRCANILVKLRCAARPGDHHADRLVHQDPADCDGNKIIRAKDLFELLHTFQSKLIGHSGKGLPLVKGSALPVICAMIPFSKNSFFIILAREQTACQRNAGDDAAS